VSSLKPLLFGPLRSHPAAPAFAAEVVRVHRRYAVEVVASHRLCPFVRDPDVAFGRFCVVLARELSLDDAREAYRAADNPVLHIVYPITAAAPAEFERFGGDVGRAVREIWRAVPDGDPRYGPEAPVIATFHRKLAGERSSPHRLIGLLRRAPDPFVQIIPGGHHEGGTVVAPLGDLEGLAPDALVKLLQSVPAPPKDRTQELFERLSAAVLDDIAARVADIHADRDRAYAPLLAELGCT
jgi:hypothetical protein